MVQNNEQNHKAKRQIAAKKHIHILRQHIQPEKQKQHLQKNKSKQQSGPSEYDMLDPSFSFIDGCVLQIADVTQIHILKVFFHIFT